MPEKSREKLKEMAGEKPEIFEDRGQGGIEVCQFLIVPIPTDSYKL